MEKLWLKLDWLQKEWIQTRAQMEGMTAAQYMRDLIDDDIANTPTSGNAELDARAEAYRSERSFRGKVR